MGDDAPRVVVAQPALSTESSSAGEPSGFVFFEPAPSSVVPSSPVVPPPVMVGLFVEGEGPAGVSTIG